MVIVDFLVKLYYSFFRKYGEAGVDAAIYVASIPLGFNVLIVFYILHLIFLGRLNYAIELLTLLDLIATVGTYFFLRKHYLKGKRIESVKLRFIIIY